MSRLYRMPAPPDRYDPHDEAQFRQYLERELYRGGVTFRGPAAGKAYDEGNEREFRRALERALAPAAARRFIAPTPDHQYSRLNESQFRRGLEGLVLAAAVPRHRDVWAWWTASQGTFTNVAATVPTSPTGPSGINPVRGWIDSIGGFKLFIEFNPTAGEPRHHTPTDGTGIGGWHSVEYFDGGNKHNCTDAGLMALVSGVRTELVFITVVRMSAGGAATQTVAALASTGASSADDSIHSWRREGGLWRTTRRFGAGTPVTHSAGTADNAAHVRTEILYLDGGTLRNTRRIDGVEISDAALDTGADDFQFTRLIAGNTNWRSGAGGTLHGYVGDLLLAPYLNAAGEVFDWEYYEGLIRAPYGL